MQLPVPSDSSTARWHKQPGHSFLSSSWGQQLLLSCRARGTPFPGRSVPGQTREQVVRIRNTSVGNCFKTRLFSSKQENKRCRKKRPASQCRRVPCRSPAQPCLAAASTSASPSVLHPPCLLLSMGTAGGGTQREEVVTGRRQQPRRRYLPEAGNVAPRPGGSRRARGWIHPT